MKVFWQRIGPALSLLGAVMLSACGGGGGSIGAACDTSPECASKLQCLGGVCTTRCQDHLDCGDGFLCAQDGTCEEVESEIGDSCARELDCGPGQSCQLDSSDADGDGMLGATCQASGPGSVTGSDCVVDGNCRSGTCALGRCTEVCAADVDCPGTLTCTRLPRLLPQSDSLFDGCLQRDGLLSHRIPLTSPFGRVRIPVPSRARSLSIVNRVGDPTQVVGLSRLAGPSGGVLFAEPATEEDFFENPIRYRKAPAVSTLLLPNTTEVALSVGVYAADVGSYLPEGGPGTEIPAIEVLYKLDEAATLDLHFVFLELESHPCAEEIDVGDLGAESAPLSPDFQDRYLATLRSILEGAGLAVGEVTYRDLGSRPDADGLRAQDLGTLLEESDKETGVEVFFVRSIAPEGIQALSAATPGAPRTPGSRASGIAIAADTLCYRDWSVLARATAHAVARHLGLFRNRELDGHLDPIPGSDDSPDNLMYFGEFGGVEVSAGQRHVLRLSPALRRSETSQSGGAALDYTPLEPPAASAALVEVLSGIDVVPTRDDLDSALGSGAAADLRGVAGDAGADPGLRLRAYRALALYPTPEVETALISAVSEHGADGQGGMETAFLRAAMSALAQVAGADGVSDITPMLSHPSRDVRASAAFALATCGSPAAIPPLRERLNQEEEDQVKLAISAAIRTLDGS